MTDIRAFPNDAGYAPRDKLWHAMDMATYDGAPDQKPHLVGYGPTAQDAIEDLLNQIAEESAGFAPEDYSYTAKLLRQYIADADTKSFRAVCSNNANIILAALDLAGNEP